jgi:hypothetical protein
MSKKAGFITFRATIEYKVEVGEDGSFQPTTADETINWTDTCDQDPEIVDAEISVEEL